MEKTGNLWFLRFAAGMMMFGGIGCALGLTLDLLRGTLLNDANVEDNAELAMYALLGLSGGWALWTFRWWGLVAYFLITLYAETKDLFEATNTISIIEQSIKLVGVPIVGLYLWFVLKQHRTFTRET